jgi:hypothetical protein
MHRVAVVGSMRRESWLGLYDDHPFFIVLS